MTVRESLQAIIRDHDAAIGELARDVEAAGHGHGTFAIVVTRERVEANAAELLGFMSRQGVQLFALSIRASQRVLLAALAKASAEKLETARPLELPGLARQLERESVHLAQLLGVVPPAAAVHVVPIAAGSASVGTLRRAHV